MKNKWRPFQPVASYDDLLQIGENPTEIMVAIMRLIAPGLDHLDDRAIYTNMMELIEMGLVEIQTRDGKDGPEFRAHRLKGPAVKRRKDGTVDPKQWPNWMHMRQAIEKQFGRVRMDLLATFLSFKNSKEKEDWVMELSEEEYVEWEALLDMHHTYLMEESEALGGQPFKPQ